MIILKEHDGYAKDTGLIELSAQLYQELIECGHNKFIFNSNTPCYRFKALSDTEELSFQTNFFIGVDWLIENKLALYVKPKLNQGAREIDFLKILFEALEDTNNIGYMDKLVTVYFDRPTVKITQQQDLLTPFLIVQFLQVLKSIVKKGLKKSYYPIIDNLNSRIKGRILVNRTIKENTIKHKITQNLCQFNEFGVNNDENKLLKKVYSFCCCVWPSYEQTFTKTGYLSQIQDTVNFIAPAFERVSNDINIKALKTFKANPVYKEYNQAIKIAKVLLKKGAYNISEQQRNKIDTYPFWIDMSKLFELYIYSKLRKALPKAKIHFQPKIDYYIPDYLLDTVDNDGTPIKMVIDAKYTTKYKDEKARQSDIRQLCSYARQSGVHEMLAVEHTKIIDCLIIYADQEAEEGLSFETIKQAKPEKAYINFYKLGIKLPEINK